MIPRRPVLIGLASYVATSIALFLHAAISSVGPFA